MAVWRADRARTSQAELTVEKGVSGNETAMGVKEVRPEYGRKGRPAAGSRSTAARATRARRSTPRQWNEYIPQRPYEPSCVH